MWVFIGVDVLSPSEYGGDQLHLTVNSQNLRGYAGSNQTSGIHETLYETVRKGTAPPCADFGVRVY